MIVWFVKHSENNEKGDDEPNVTSSQCLFSPADSLNLTVITNTFKLLK